ncbi:hypothetical protein HYV81_06365 [Candidatus Woesearchaeota archaeon]|nr:hypothetical protein [Candidatus Woesearchaeota archaeon]
MSTQKPELGAEEKIRTLIDDITNNISKPSSHFGDALDAASKYSEEDQKQYAYFREVFRQLREKLKTIPDIKLIDEQIREALEKGLNPDLIVKETLVHKNFIIFLERLILIINTAQKMEKNELNFGHIGPEFDKYLVSNFYRTMCEVTIKLFINLLTSILNYWLKDLSQKITQTEEELDKIDYWKKLLKKIEKNSLGLHDFKTILTTLDKRENFNLNLNRLV